MRIVTAGLGATATVPAVAAETMSVTATGTELVKVVPKNRKSNASSEAAVAAAQKAGIRGALAAAHANAIRYADAAGLTLGGVISVCDVANNSPFFSPFGGNVFEGSFGPNRYCGIERRPVFKTVNKKRKLVRVRKVHACMVRGYEATTLTVTYSAT